jgi:hypothetical protein
VRTPQTPAAVKQPNKVQEHQEIYEARGKKAA